MGINAVKRLSGLTDAELEQEAQQRSFPKWNSLCLLKLLAQPVLDAIYIPPYSLSADLARGVREFMSDVGSENLLLRSDGGIERGAYHRGGNTHDKQTILKQVYGLSCKGRAVLLQEPTNRFTNILSVNLLIHSEGSLTVELLGPGYDVSDLNRGGIRPQVILTGKQFNWRSYERASLSDFEITFVEGEEERRQRRLEIIGTEVLPDMGVHVEGDPQYFAEQWLKAQNYTSIWSRDNITIQLSTLRMWYDTAFLVAHWISRWRDWVTLAISGSDLGERFIWWDITDGLNKYGLKRTEPWDFTDRDKRSRC